MNYTNKCLVLAQCSAEMALFTPGQIMLSDFKTKKQEPGQAA